MEDGTSDIVAWVSSNVLPFEAELRGWLRNVLGDAQEVDDLVQDIYCRLLNLSSVAHIAEPRAYLYQVARSLIINRLRRRAIVRIDTVQNMDEVAGFDAGPSPEQVTMARAELKWVLGLIANLPERCRAVFRLRKIYGLSQAETAKALSVSENVVEKETMRSLNLISETVARVGVADYTAVRKAKAKRAG